MGDRRIAIAVVGSINMDLVVQVERIPRPGETLSGNRLSMIPGGKGANQAVAAARLGARTHFIGKVGDDAFGIQLRDQLQANGVHIEALGVPARTSSGVALIHVSAEGENSITIIGGANSCLLPADLPAWSRYLMDSDVVLLQLEIPIETVVAVAQLARKHHIPVLLDPAPVPPAGLPEALFQVDYLTPNQTEAELLTGLPVTTIREAETAARNLVGKGVKHAIIKLGAQGAMLVSRESSAIYVPSTAVSAVDTTAAGDAFNAALGVALAEGKSVIDGIRFGCAAGALAVTRHGAQTSMPNRREIEDLRYRNPS